MISVAVVTSTRAEYGLMRPLIFNLIKDEDIDFSLIVTGTHLSPQYGYTITEIEDDGVPIRSHIEIIPDKIEDTATIMSNTLSKFSAYFKNNKFDYLVVDGDRYEMFAVCIAAVLNNIPIAHCGGGETTEGANDEYWRHCMTKLSYLHFPIMNEYRNRIIQMGENPNRVFNVGSLGLENIRNMIFSSKEEVSKRVKLALNKPYALVTFHPVTLDNSSSIEQIKELLQALDYFEGMDFIITKANADKEGEKINQIIEEYAKNKKNVVFVSSLGAQYYLSAMRYSEMVIGNSSSGIIETPTFKIPTINIGDRQKGRIQANTIINCEPKKEDIIRAILKGKSIEFKRICEESKNPNGDGNASLKIIKHLKESFSEGIDLQKSFYDLTIGSRG